MTENEKNVDTAKANVQGMEPIFPAEVPDDNGGLTIEREGDGIVIAVDLDEENDLAAIEELTKALSEFLDESDGQAGLAVDYIVGVVEAKAKIARAQTAEEFEQAFAESVVLPLAQAAKGAPNPNVAVSALMGFDDAEMLSEIGSFEKSGIMNVDPSQIDLARLRAHFMKLCREGIGDEATDAALRDVARYHEQRESGTLPEIPQVKLGFFKRLKMMKACATKQMGVLRNLLKQSHNLRDIEIWYSRYLLSAPIEFAREHGYTEPAKAAAMATDEQVKKDCAQLAQSMGYDCESWDVDYARVAHAMRTFCVNKTGYSYVENWLYAAMSRHDGFDGALLSTSRRVKN